MFYQAKKTIWVFSFFILLTGCGGGNLLSSPATPAAAALAASKAADYVKESFTPHYKLHALPLEFCFQDGGHYTCFLTPCEGDGCELTLTPDEWRDANAKVASLRTSVALLNSVMQYCDANRAQHDFCAEALYTYQGGLIVEVK